MHLYSKQGFIKVIAKQYYPHPNKAIRKLNTFGYNIKMARYDYINIDNKQIVLFQYNTKLDHNMIYVNLEFENSNYFLSLWFKDEHNNKYL